jgi:DNA-binding NarL/FixJ family response regulator
MTPTGIRVIIADDHPVFRGGIRALLESMGMSVVAEADDGQEAVALAIELRPEVVLMDLQMPALSGIEATRRICEQTSGVGICVVTMHEDDESVFAAIRAGALGYVLKGAPPDEVERAVRAVAAGEAIYGPSVARRVMAFFAAGNARQLSPFPELTDREREILGLVAAGMKNADIARRLFLSPKTVRNHVSNILSKLRLADRSEAIVRAREAGMHPSSPDQ